MKENNFLRSSFSYHNKNYFLIIFLVFAVGLGLFFWFSKKNPNSSLSLRKEGPSSSKAISFKGLKKFSSEEEFKQYLQKGLSLSFYSFEGKPRLLVERNDIVGQPPLAQEKEILETPSDRFSQTNVQVKNIDEPDIIKTNGREIFYSLQSQYYSFPIIKGKENIDFSDEKETFLPPKESRAETKIIEAFPPSSLSQKAVIAKSGDLLLSSNTLIIFEPKNIVAFDIADAQNPKESWRLEFNNNSHLVTARLYQNNLYLVTVQGVNFSQPCPIRPFVLADKPQVINCVDIYYPPVGFVSDVVYSAWVLDSQTGEVKNQISLVGSNQNSVVYMSKDNLYLTYYFYSDFFQPLADFISQKAVDFFPEWALTKIKNLSQLDISLYAKQTEYQQILNQIYQSLDENQQLKFQNELNNLLTDFFNEQKRDLEKTGIAKISLEDFKIIATGEIPGKLLNQFSLDEYRGFLRIAVNLGNFWGWFWQPNLQSVNDIYILDSNLKPTGEILDLGLSEKIYSCRFLEDKGYLVTFRQTDPFYVLDLTDPKNPQMVGELKIPGFSSYLHPLNSNLMLGIGQENGQVKLSLFDVANPKNPQEKDKYLLQEYWSEITNNHHAFLQDEKHQVFFLPAGGNGYVFSYENNKLTLKTVQANIQAKRALYINDYLYLIGIYQIVVISENDWQQVNKLEFNF